MSAGPSDGAGERGHEEAIGSTHAARPLRRDVDNTGARLSLAGPRKNPSLQKGENQDWPYAIGACTTGHTAYFVYMLGDEGPHGQIERERVLHRFDHDNGKAVTIAGLTVHDEQLGRLANVGLAKEYSLQATPSTQSRSFAFGSAQPPGSGEDTPLERGDQARDREDGRSDPVRARQ